MDEEKSVWEKTQAEVTMEEQVKIMLGVAFITAAFPALFGAIGYAVTSYVEKRKREKLQAIVDEFKKENEPKEQD